MECKFLSLADGILRVQKSFEKLWVQLHSLDLFSDAKLKYWQQRARIWHLEPNFTKFYWGIKSKKKFESNQTWIKEKDKKKQVQHSTWKAYEKNGSPKLGRLCGRMSQCSIQCWLYVQIWGLRRQKKNEGSCFRASTNDSIGLMTT